MVPRTPHLEIEHTFLVKRELLPELPSAPMLRIEQSYLSSQPPVARVRRKWFIDGHAESSIDVKGPGTLTRVEFGPYAIPPEHYEPLAALSPWLCIEKDWYALPDDWELHVFRGANEGLLLAEIEIPTESDPFTQPSWLGDEVTEDHRFANVQLAQRPFSSWLSSWQDAVRQGVVPRGSG